MSEDVVIVVSRVHIEEVTDRVPEGGYVRVRGYIEDSGVSGRPVRIYLRKGFDEYYLGTTTTNQLGIFDSNFKVPDGIGLGKAEVYAKYTDTTGSEIESNHVDICICTGVSLTISVTDKVVPPGETTTIGVNIKDSSGNPMNAYVRIVVKDSEGNVVYDSQVYAENGYAYDTITLSEEGTYEIRALYEGYCDYTHCYFDAASDPITLTVARIEAYIYTDQGTSVTMSPEEDLTVYGSASLPNAEFTLKVTRPDGTWASIATVTTDSQGSFSKKISGKILFRYLGPSTGNIALFYSSDRLVSNYIDVTMIAPSKIELTSYPEKSLRPGDEFEVKGVLEYATDYDPNEGDYVWEPLPNATVLWEWDENALNNGAKNGQTTTDADGSFTVRTNAPEKGGRYVLTIRYPGSGQGSGVGAEIGGTAYGTPSNIAPSYVRITIGTGAEEERNTAMWIIAGTIIAGLSILLFRKR